MIIGINSASARVCYLPDEKCRETKEVEVLGNTCQRDGQTYGDCLDCADETNMNNNCVKQGYSTCCGDRTPIGEPVCDCGGVKYYAACQVVETCFEGSYYLEDKYGYPIGYCDAIYEEKWNNDTYYKNNGYYKVEDKCTKSDGRKVIGYRDCHEEKYRGIDCAGNMPPAAGLRYCADLGLYPVGNVVTCGGKVYSSACGGECNSEMTENDCPDSFIPVCSDGTTIFGECGN